MKKMSKKTKLIWGGVGLLIVIGLIGNAIGGGDQGDAEAAPDTATSAPATTKAPAPEKTEAPLVDKEAAPTESDQDYADRIYAAWLNSRGAASQAEVLAQSPDNIQGYLVSAESPVNGTVVFTAQLTKADVTKDELQQAAMAVLQLVGLDDESLDRVEIVTADDLLRGVVNRSASPLLNLDK